MRWCVDVHGEVERGDLAHCLRAIFSLLLLMTAQALLYLLFRDFGVLFCSVLVIIFRGPTMILLVDICFW